MSPALMQQLPSEIYFDGVKVSGENSVSIKFIFSVDNINEFLSTVVLNDKAIKYITKENTAVAKVVKKFCQIDLADLTNKIHTTKTILGDAIHEIITKK